MSEHKAYLHPSTGNLVVYGKLAWTALFTPKGMQNDETAEAKYQVTLLLPKDADISAAHKAAQNAAVKKFGETKAKGGGLRSPFRKSEENDKIAAAGLAEAFPFYVTARSKDRPGVVGPDGKRVEEPEKVYQGRMAKVSMQAFGYDTKGNRGVSFGLQNVQLLDEAEPLSLGGERVSAEAEFEPVEGVAGNEAGSADNIFA